MFQCTLELKRTCGFGRDESHFKHILSHTHKEGYFRPDKKKKMSRCEIYHIKMTAQKI